MNEKNQLVLFKSKDGQVSLPVTLERETVWLSQRQMADLFGKDRTVIGRHIRNAIEEGEVDEKVVCANFAHTTRHGAMEDTYNGDHMSMHQVNASFPKTMVLAAQYKRNCVPDGPKITLSLLPRADWRMPSDAESR